MTRSCHTGCLVSLVLLCAGCTSLPEVEQQLQSMQFYSNLYVVQAGETVETVAYRYNMSPQQLAELNPGINGYFRPGARLNVRPGTVLPQQVRSGGAYLPGSNGLASVPTGSVPAGDGDGGVVVSPTTRTSSAAIVPAPGVLPPALPPALPSAGVQGSAVPALAASDGALYPHEEIIEDDLDQLEPGGTRAEIDRQLQDMVGAWRWPTDGQVARNFAPQEVNGQGVDIAGVPGQDVRAALDGTVVYSGRDLSGGGNLVILSHPNDLMTTYSHADSLFVAEDDVVHAGDPIASLGWNSSQESVLRFEVRRGGNPLNPLEFLPAR